jgi:Bacterial SCP ortholog
MPARLRQLPSAELVAVLARIDDATSAGQRPDPDDLRAAVKHFLAVLAVQAPGSSVEVRVPPFAAVQCVQGARHTRGTPPAVVETDAVSWLALARGTLSFDAAVRRAAVRASGERSDLTPYLPLC